MANRRLLIQLCVCAAILAMALGKEKTIKTSRFVSRNQPRNNRDIYHQFDLPDENSNYHPNSVNYVEDEEQRNLETAGIGDFFEIGKIENAIVKVAADTNDAINIGKIENAIEKVAADTNDDIQTVVEEAVNVSKPIIKIKDDVTGFAEKVGSKIEDTGTGIGNFFENTWEKMDDYFHKFLRVLEVLGLFLLVCYSCKLYRMAYKLYRFIKCIFGSTTQNVSTRTGSTATRPPTVAEDKV